MPWRWDGQPVILQSRAWDEAAISNPRAEMIVGENDVMNKETLAKVRMPNRDAFVSRYPDKH
jgi:hypothetical protein